MDNPINRSEEKSNTLKKLIVDKALCFLPAKVTVRFRTVCKDWERAMTETPRFASSQSYHHRLNSCFFFQKGDEPPLIISSDPKSYDVPDPSLGFLPEPVHIKSSCNGLLCCQSRADSGIFYICNPATRQWRKLPESEREDHLGAVLAYEPSPDSGARYQLICPRVSIPNQLEMNVFSAGGDLPCLWEPRVVINNQDIEFEWDSGVYVNGCAFWKKGNNRKMFGFNVATHQGREVIKNLGEGTALLGTVDGKFCTFWLSPAKIRGIIDYLADDDITQEEIGLAENTKIIAGVDQSVILKAGPLIIFCDMLSLESQVLRDDCDGAVKCLPYVNSLAWW